MAYNENIDEAQANGPAIADVKMSAASAASTNWKRCDGAEISRTTYADLFAEIGTTFGVGDGSTTFNLPDYQGRFPVGVGTHADVNALGDDDGEGTVANRTPNASSDDPGNHLHTISHTHNFPHTHTGTTSQNGSVHTHTFSDGFTTAATGGLSSVKSGTGTTRPTSGHVHTGSVSGTTSTANVQHTHTMLTSVQSTNTVSGISTSNSGSDGAHTHEVSNPFLAIHFDIYAGVA